MVGPAFLADRTSPNRIASSAESVVEFWLGISTLLVKARKPMMQPSCWHLKPASFYAPPVAPTVSLRPAGGGDLRPSLRAGAGVDGDLVRGRLAPLADSILRLSAARCHEQIGPTITEKPCPYRERSSVAWLTLKRLGAYTQDEPIDGGLIGVAASGRVSWRLDRWASNSCQRSFWWETGCGRKPAGCSAVLRRVEPHGLWWERGPS